MIEKLKIWVSERWKSAQAFKILYLGLLIFMATTNYLNAWPTDVFAAASLKEPVDKLSASYFLKTGVNV